MRALTAVVLAAAVSLTPGFAYAKAKTLSDGSGCTAAQIQKWGNFGLGKACLDANQSGTLPEAQTLYCSSDGSILCCQNGGDNRHDCTVIGHEIASRPVNGTITHLPSTQAP